MIAVENLEEVIWGIALLAPGFLIMFGRSRFLTGRMPSVASSVFEYLMVSSTYFALVYPLFLYISVETYVGALAFLFVLPLVMGLLLGFGTQANVFRKIIQHLGMNPVHASPTAWDFVFSGRNGFSWVVVNLNSGGRYFGILGPSSMASSDLRYRDIYLEEVRTEAFASVERDGRKRGVWINETDIRSIEIIEDNEQ